SITYGGLGPATAGPASRDPPRPSGRLSNSGYLYTFNLFFTAFLFTFRPIKYLIRTVSSDAF
ncbi:hypothetical protein L249_5506, partial [Ophiocordyceps polyrhachis-furcata BCC 54312]